MIGIQRSRLLGLMVRPKPPQIEDREYANTFYPRSPELSFLIRGG